MTWFDDGTRVRVYVSTSGDFVSLGTRTDYPFANPISGVPQGWTFWGENGGVASDVYMSVANGRWSIQNVSSSNANSGKHYNIVRDFPVNNDNRYLIEVQAQTMQGKSSPYRGVLWSPNNVGGPYGSLLPSLDQWETVKLPITNFASDTFIRVYLKANPYWSDPADYRTDWALQMQNFAVIQIPKVLPKPSWAEITCDVQSCVTRYGRAKFTERYDVATAQLQVRNDDGEFTYDPYPDTAAFRPGRFIRVTVTPPGSSTEYPHYYGVIDSVEDDYTLDGHAVVNIDCVDTSSLLANTNVPTVSSQGQTYSSGSRIYALATVAQLDLNTVYVDSGVFTQQAISANGRTIRDEMGVCSDSEGGYLYTDRLGNLYYRDRTAPSRISTWNTVQGELLGECAQWIYHNKLSFIGGSGNYGTIPTSTAFDFTNNFDIIAKVTVNDIDGPQQTIVQRGLFWYLRKQAGTRRLEGRLSATNVVCTADLPYGNGQTCWVRLRRYLTANLVFYTAPATASNDIPPEEAWTILGDVTPLGIAMTPSTNPITIGANDLGANGWNGDIRRVFLRGQTNATIVDVYPLATMDGYEGQTSVPITIPTTPMAITQTTGHSVVTPDALYPSTELVKVDTIPTVAAAPIVNLHALGTNWSRDRVVNEIQLANEGGVAYRVLNADSQKRYGPRTYQRLDFVNVNNQPSYLETRANDYLTGYTDAILRVNSVSYRPTDDTYVFTMKLFLNDLVRVRYTNRLNGWGYSVVSHVQQIGQSISTSGWQVQLLLDHPEAFNAWDQAQEGVGWDDSEWDDGKWDGVLQAFWSREAKWSDGISTWG